MNLERWTPKSWLLAACSAPEGCTDAIVMIITISKAFGMKPAAEKMGTSELRGGVEDSMKPAATSQDTDASEVRGLIPRMQAHFAFYSKMFVSIKNNLLN